MRNRRISGTRPRGRRLTTSPTMDKDYEEILARLRPVLPSGWAITAVDREPRLRSAAGRPARPDLVLELRAPDGSRSKLVVEVKKQTIEPRDVLKVVSQLNAYSAALPRPRRGEVAAVPFVAAAFVSPRARDLLSNLGAGYVDNTGNLRLVLDRPAVFVERSGSDRNPLREERPLQSLKGPAAGRVVRALCDFKPPYGVRELAERAGTPLASVSRALEFLEREAIVTRNENRAVTDVDWPALIRRWAQDYTFADPARTGTFRDPRGTEAFLERLSTADVQYALTGSFAASKVASIAVPRLAAVYAANPRKAEQALGLRKAETAANIILVQAFDPVVFDRAWKRDGLTIAALSQVAADLLGSPGRGPEEAKELIQWMQTNEQTWRVR
jgi:hypothetical protein